MLKRFSDLWQFLNGTQFRSGSADPEGSVTAPSGSIYLRTNGQFYKKSSGSGNTGWEEIEAGGGGGGVSGVHIGMVNGRLTTESGVPVSTSDRTAQSTIYFTPYKGNQIALYDGADWQLETFSELSLALSGLTSGKNYDVFVDYNAGSPQLVLGTAWTNDTTRAVALTLQDGVYVLTGATDHRYVGTIRTTGTTTTEDSRGGVTTQVGGKRFVWNYYNQVPRTMSVIDTANSWSYTTDTVRQANAAAGNKVEWVNGDAGLLVDARLCASIFCQSNSARTAKVGIGIDSTTAFSGLVGENYCLSGSGSEVMVPAAYGGQPGIGYHYAAWCEKGADGTSSFIGDNGGGGAQSGLIVHILN